jgi:hypothetical protein
MDARVELAERVAGLSGREWLRPHALAAELDAIGAIARRAGAEPAARVARLVEMALARGESGALIHGWLHLLAEAAACGRDDPDTARAYAAACQVRIAA